MTTPQAIISSLLNNSNTYKPIRSDSIAEPEPSQTQSLKDKENKNKAESINLQSTFSLNSNSTNNNHSQSLASNNNHNNHNSNSTLNPQASNPTSHNPQNNNISSHPISLSALDEPQDLNTAQGNNNLTTNINTNNNDGITNNGPRSPASLESKELKGEKAFTATQGLLTIPFFSNLDFKSMRKLTASFRKLTFKPGQIIFKEGETQSHNINYNNQSNKSISDNTTNNNTNNLNPNNGNDNNNANEFCVIVRGNVSLTATDSNGQQMQLAVKKMGDFFGSYTLAPPKDIPNSVKNIENSQINNDNHNNRNHNAYAANHEEQALLSNESNQNSSECQPSSPSLNDHRPGEVNHQTSASSLSRIDNEQNLLTPRSRPQSIFQPVTAVALEETLLFAISNTEFASFCLANPDVHVMLSSSSISSGPSSTHIQLRSIPFFSHIPELKLQQLAVLFEFKSCEAGECICREGDVGTGFYIIVSGRVNVSARGPNGASVHLNTLTKGEWLGEIALIQNTLRTATLTSVQPCVLLYLSREKFNIFTKLAPEVRETGAFDRLINKRTANSLKAIPLFSFLQKKQIGPLTTFDEHKLGLLGELFKFVQFPANTKIIKEGERADAFYIIVRGVVQIRARISNELSPPPSPRTAVNSNENSLNTHNTSTGSNDEDGICLTELSNGDWFGEIALVSNTTRTATVCTLSQCLMLKLVGEDFHKFLEIVPQVRATLERVMSVRTAHTLSQIPLFRVVKENKPWWKLGILGTMFAYELFEENAVIVKEGSVGDKFYVIIDGIVEVSKTVQRSNSVTNNNSSSNNNQTEKVVLETLGKNSWFGEIALMKETPRLATVTCKEECLLLSVTKEKFQKFLTIAPDLLHHFSSLLTHRTANVIRSIDFFTENIKENKPWSKMELLCSLFDYQYIDMGVTILKAGVINEASDKFYVIVVGSVEIQVGPQRQSQPQSQAQAQSDSSNSEQGLDVNDESKLKKKALTDDESIAAAFLNEFSLVPSMTKDSNIILSKGSFFNVLSLLESVPPPHNVKTLEGCVFFTLTRDKFNKFLTVAPELRAALANLTMENKHSQDYYNLTQ